MLEKIKSIMDKVNQAQEELQGIETKVNEVDMERLQQAIKLSMKGLKFNKIFSEKIARPAPNYDEYIYFEGIKGIKLCHITKKYQEGTYGKSYERRELFLLSDGTFKVFHETGKISFYATESDYYEKIVSENQDITDFEVDDILKGLFEALNDRLENLGERTKTQKERMEKLNLLQIK